MQNICSRGEVSQINTLETNKQGTKDSTVVTQKVKRFNENMVHSVIATHMEILIKCIISLENINSKLES